MLLNFKKETIKFSLFKKLLSHSKSDSPWGNTTLMDQKKGLEFGVGRIIKIIDSYCKQKNYLVCICLGSSNVKNF